MSSAIWGEFHELAANEGGHLDVEGRRNWARVALLELDDARIAELEAHRATLDLDRIEQDRLEAPARSRFDDFDASVAGQALRGRFGPWFLQGPEGVPAN